MILLARNHEPLTLPEVSAREGLSLPYAAKLLMILKHSGMVNAARGRRGGYQLARPAEEIFLKEIFDALGEPVFGANHCEKYSGESDSCIHTGDCVVKNVWGAFNDFVSNYMEKTTLAQLAAGGTPLQELSVSEKEIDQQILEK